MRIFALALELDEDFFVRRSDRHVTNMRINYYPAQERPPEPGQLRAGAHSDYGAFTILKGENAPGGLQVLRRGGDWADVPRSRTGSSSTSVTLLMRWTNEKWVSTIHRVVNPPEEIRHNVDRMSVAFFFRAQSRHRGELHRKLYRPGKSAALSAGDRGRPLARQNFGRSPNHRKSELSP